MKQNWTYRDIIDLEYFCHQDTDKSPDILHKRDRAVFLESTWTAETEGTKNILHHWLQARRKSDVSNDNTGSPGSIVQESFRLLGMLLPAIGLACGFGSGLAFFSYSGTTPVNVFHFLVLFVLSQLTMLALLAGTITLRLSGIRKAVPSMISRLYSSLIIGFAAWLQRRMTQNLTADKRHSFEHALGLSKKAGHTYGYLLYWPLFTLSQRVMVSFNGGLLAATLFRVTTSDVAFGWQSTMQFSATAIHRTVQILALPWSWLVSGYSAYPSLQEIEGSRIVLKDGIYHLATQDLISWWPFLVFCVLVYGLFFRLLLVLLGKFLAARALNKLDPVTPACLRVVRRMQTPLVSTQAAPGPEQPYTTLEVGKPAAMQTARTSRPDYTLTVLIPDDIADYCHSENIYTLLRQHGFALDQQEIIMRDYESDQILLQQLRDTSWKGEKGVLIIMESWMPPIGDFLIYLKEMRRAVGLKTAIFVGLVGRPEEDTPFTLPSAGDSNIWRQKINGQGDPYLNVFDLLGPNQRKADNT